MSIQNNGAVTGAVYPSTSIGTLGINGPTGPLGASIVSGTTQSPWTTSITNSSVSVGSIKPPNTLELHGEDADIVINEVSLMDTLRGIQDRLNLLQPNKKLEAQWQELQELGQRYRELEKELNSATKMWDILSRE